MNAISPLSSGFVGAVFGASSDAVLGCDSRGGILYANKAAAKLFGWNCDELQMRSIDALMPPRFAADHLKYMEQYESTGRSRVVGNGRIVQLQRKDGAKRAVRITVLDLRNTPFEDGRVAYIGLLRDVSEHVQLRSSLVAAKASAEIAQRASRDLLSRVTHLLRTPLNAVIGFSSLLEEDRTLSRDEIVEYAGDIRAAGAQLLTMVNNLVGQAQLQRFEPDLQEGPCPIRALLDEAALVVPPRRMLRLHPDPHLQFLLLDRRATIAALSALVDNAFRYSAGDVELGSALQESGEADIWIRDHGDGFVLNGPPLQEGFLTDRNQCGLGLGLKIARSAIELHGGSLCIEPAEGGGTVVLLRFPASRVLECGDQLSQPEHQQGASSCPLH